MTAPIVWSGRGSNPIGKTPFGYYDRDTAFVAAAPKVADFCARRLGYPILDVELVDSQFYACFEEAVTEYGSQVNQFNLRENMLRFRGISTSENLSGRNIVTTIIPQMVIMAASYGTEALVGGNVELKRGSIDMMPGTQSYDLKTLYSEVSESGKRIEVRKVHHEMPPAISRYFDPYATSGLGLQQMMNEFGFGQMSISAQFIMMPMFEDLLRIQAIEFNDTIRRSAYTFQLVDNQIKIFPVPTTDVKVWFEYYVVDDKLNSVLESSGSVSDYSNAPYHNIQYSYINDVGKMWIVKYTLALAKDTLGAVRGKYQTIPIPGAEVTLDGAALRAEAAVEKENLIKEIRETLEQTGNKAQMQKEMENSDNISKVFQKIPVLIYVG